MAELTITEFTDPACPFAWSAEPYRLRLRWLYGEQLSWRLRMVGLSASRDEYAEKGFTPERQAASFRSLAERHHMPMDAAERPRMSATLPACRAVVATRLHEPERERDLLRRLRVRHFAGDLLPAARRRAAPAGVEEVLAWAGEPLASIEVATVCEMEPGEAREALGRVAVEQHLGFDGLWSLSDEVSSAHTTNDKE